ncbi:MAG: DUF1549 and DUF1553 domain-containing protein [Planctomycetota bacterium]|nr:DUF1549 and DUF1553 domain-containing protein [Planctomycetota bacterium]
MRQVLVVFLGIFLAQIAFAATPTQIEFSVDVISVLSKAGCNAGTCHGNLNGKGGLKLSLRGQDPLADYHTLVFASRGRRVTVNAPEQSLILQKATGQVPHRGGARIRSDSSAYKLLKQWLELGAPPPSKDAVLVTHLQVEPLQAIVRDPNDSINFKVNAVFSDGTSRDVTESACYEMSNLLARVDANGKVTRAKFGESTLIVRYLDQQVPVPIAFTESRSSFVWDEPAEFNQIDRFVFKKLRRLKINPSPICGDSVFVRRAYQDVLGRIPTAAEARQFVHDESPGKRNRLIDSLLSRDAMADYWALKWADMLRVEEKVLDVDGVDAFHDWIRGSIADAKPMDQFVRDLITGVGSTFQQPAANFYRANRDPSTRGETAARLFLGTRLQCAKCHNHPFDRWTQDDYYSWATLFSQLDYEVGENKRRDKLDKNEFVGDQTVVVSKQDEVRHPNTKQFVAPKFLGGKQLTESQPEQRLGSVADWVTSPENKMFAATQANFVWYHLMGTGLVDPIDDFRLTNPASNPALLNFLADEMVQSGFDLRAMIRLVMSSRTYQLASVPNHTNVNDEFSYSRVLTRRLPAEVLLDMQSDVLGTAAQFAGYESGMRAVQIPGVRRKRLRDERPNGGDRFLQTFGKPERILACDCERSNGTTLKQVFVLMGESLNRRLAEGGNRLQTLVDEIDDDARLVDELYWTALSRSPTEVELSAALQMFRSEKRWSSIESVLESPRTARLRVTEDLVWALLNAKEFLFRR